MYLGNLYKLCIRYILEASNTEDNTKAQVTKMSGHNLNVEVS